MYIYIYIYMCVCVCSFGSIYEIITLILDIKLAFIQLRCFKLIKSDSKNICNVKLYFK